MKNNRSTRWFFTLAWRTLVALLLYMLYLVPAASSQEGVDFFERKIRPALVQHCYSCHSVEAKKTKGGLLLDTKKGLLEGGDNGPAIVPGHPDKSLLIKAIRYTDPDIKMPKKEKLPAEVIADFEKWVKMGAPDPRTGSVKIAHKYPTIEEGRTFWAFQPPKLPAIPKVNDTKWPHGDIDRLVLAKLEAKKLQPSRDAEPGVLLRRLHYALIGLPPTVEELDSFTKAWQAAGAKREAAIVEVVDRLLASPHFGERWGRHWLDVARFAESSGGGRTAIFRDAWRYRDYVIHAFNSDKPLTQFIAEQLAGDLQSARTPEERYWQLVATAFLLLGPTNFERQDKPLLEMDVIDEQIDTIGKGFLGMTIGCARCHDHKFDPIPTKDYYALAGIFKSTKFIVHSNVSRWMERPLPSPNPNLEVALKKHDAAVASLKKLIQIVKAKNPQAGVVTEPLKGTPLDAKTLPGIVIDDAQARKVGNWKHSTFTGRYIGEGYLYDDRAMKGEKTLTFQPEFTEDGAYDVRLAFIPHTNRADKVQVRIFHRNGDDTVHVNQRLMPPIDSRFISLGRYRFTKGNQWFVMVSTDGANGHVVADAVQFLPEALADKESAAKQPKGERSEPLGSSSLAELEARLKRLEKSAPERPMAMAVADGDKIADMHVCIRGIVHNKGEVVPRGFLQIASPPRQQGEGFQLAKTESGRRELADWIASPDNPLTARVYVNRVWHHLFGAGLVRTVDNFGATGETPSHPELLDYLAVRFSSPHQPGAQATGYGWSTKRLIRAIVLSHAYQMSSEANADGLKTDPENRLLWRMNRQRLQAEQIRDTILMVSGQLDRATMGNTIKKGTIAEREYQFDDFLPARRSVYVPIFRNRLHELFEVFDFPDPNMVLGRRNVSTVPTQALYLMNSPFIMAQARYAATLTLKDEMKDAARIDLAYRKTLGRSPTPRERELALAYLASPPRQRGEEAAVWERFYQTLFACVDFRYVN